MNRTRPRRGFSMVEMMVVVGIIILLAGMLLPALMKARRTARAAACASNLHQIGVLMLAYADANNDYTPLGCTGFLESEDSQPDATGYAAHWTGGGDRWWSCYPVADGEYSAGLGPLLASGMISGSGLKMLYCPMDADEHLTWRRFEPFFPAAKQPPAAHVTVRSSYFCRPVNRLFLHSQWDSPHVHVFWPMLLTRLNDVRDKAIFAERPGIPFTHATGSSAMLNVLRADGSVRMVTLPKSNLDAALAESHPASLHLPDSLPPPSTPKANPGPPVQINGSDEVMVPIWKVLDTLQ